MTLKEVRSYNNITQTDAAKIVGISLRSYKSYETEEEKEGSDKYDYILQKLNQYFLLDETHGLLNVRKITQLCDPIFKKYKVNFAFLFGSYAKNKMTPESDVDLLIDGKIEGIQYFGMIEELRTALCKKVDLIDVKHLSGNEELTREIFKDGIRIYG